ncbi:hypothetical protein [Bacillus sp. GB_SG_008]|uniref:hypothetical protein n=1 Tax=Bacillus sp. GB_SG_008 TaxID=3454627 RepID=UPI003F86812E
MSITGTPTKIDNRVLVLNLETLETTYIKTEELPINLSINGDFGYVIHNSDLTSGIITKIDLRNDKIVKQLELPGNPRNITINEDGVYVIADNVEEKSQTIYWIDKQLNSTTPIHNEFTSVPNDSAIIDGNLYIMNMSNKDLTGPTNRLTWVDSSSREIKLAELNEPSPYQIFNIGSERVIIHFDPISASGGSVSVLDSDNNTKKHYKLKNLPFKSHVYGDLLYTTDLKKLYIYDLNEFRLQESHELPVDEDMVMVDFFSK